MKRIKWMLAALIAVAIAAPAFAQSQDPHANEKWNNGKVTAAIERAAVKAKRERQASECPKCHKAYTIDEKYHGVKHECAAQPKKEVKKAPVCVRCGEQIISAGQHCEAAGYIALCTDTEETPRVQTVSSDDEANCPKCGKAYTIDERYHGTEHKCAAQPKKEVKKAPACVRCGKEITSAGQHCEAAGYTALCSDAPAKETVSVSSEDEANCPKCGKAYTIDERYHGTEHQCQKAK